MLIVVCLWFGWFVFELVLIFCWFCYLVKMRCSLLVVELLR